MGKVVPQARDLQTDLRDVQIFIRSAFEGPICIELHRHYGSKSNEIAYVVIDVTDVERRRLIQTRAEVAFRHMGYVVAPRPGSDVYEVLPRGGELSAHDAIRALARFADLDCPGVLGPPNRPPVQSWPADQERYDGVRTLFFDALPAKIHDKEFVRNKAV